MNSYIGFMLCFSTLFAIIQYMILQKETTHSQLQTKNKRSFVIIIHLVVPKLCTLFILSASHLGNSICLIKVFMMFEIPTFKRNKVN